MTQTWTRRTLYFAGAWNLMGGASALANPASHFAQMYTGALSLDDPLQAFFFRAVWINVMAWGIGYALAGRFPATRASILLAGGAGKLAYFAACVALMRAGGGSAGLAAAAVCDVAFALFFACVSWPRQAAVPPAETSARA